MNIVSKGRLQLLFLGNGPRIRNGQRGSEKLGLVDWQLKGLSDKVCLNVLRAEDVSRVRTEPSTKRDANAGIEKDNKAGIGRDNKVGIEGQDNKAGTGKQDNKVGIGGQNNNGVDNLG